MKKQLLKTVITAIVSGILFGGGAYYYFVIKEKSNKYILQRERISGLENEVASLKDNLAKMIASSENENSDTNDLSEESGSLNQDEQFSGSPSSSDATLVGNENNNQGDDNVSQGATWLTYTNEMLGYKLQYPQGWTIREVDEWSEDKFAQVRYITITSSNEAYFLHWGFQRDNTYETTDRTGVGVGDFVPVAADFQILNAEIKKTYLVNDGKTKEIFYSPKVIRHDYNWESYFSIANLNDYDAADIAGASEIDIAEDILASVELTL